VGANTGGQEAQQVSERWENNAGESTRKEKDQQPRKSKGIPKPLNPFSVMAVEEVVTSHP
jgi:hypothetical protein